MNDKDLFRCSYGGWHYLDSKCEACRTIENQSMKGDAMDKHLSKKAHTGVLMNWGQE